MSAIPTNNLGAINNPIMSVISRPIIAPPLSHEHTDFDYRPKKGNIVSVSLNSKFIKMTPPTTPQVDLINFEVSIKSNLINEIINGCFF